MFCCDIYCNFSFYLFSSSYLQLLIYRLKNVSRQLQFCLRLSCWSLFSLKLLKLLLQCLRVSLLLMKSQSVWIVVVQPLSCVQCFVTPWTAELQASLSFTIPQSLLKLMFFESVMSSKHLILCCPLLLPPSIFPSIRVFSNESVLCIRWPKYWNFTSASVLPMNIQD